MYAGVWWWWRRNGALPCMEFVVDKQSDTCMDAMFPLSLKKMPTRWHAKCSWACSTMQALYGSVSLHIIHGPVVQAEGFSNWHTWTQRQTESRARPGHAESPENHQSAQRSAAQRIAESTHISGVPQPRDGSTDWIVFLQSTLHGANCLQSDDAVTDCSAVPSARRNRRFSEMQDTCYALLDRMRCQTLTLFKSCWLDRWCLESMDPLAEVSQFQVSW